MTKPQGRIFDKDDNRDDIGPPTVANELVHHRLQRQAIRQPDSIALTRGSNTYTFGGTNGLSNYVAHQLLDQDCKRNALIGVLSPDPEIQLMFTFGVWKAGMIALILDASDPEERRNQVLSHAGVDIVVTDAGFMNPWFREIQNMGWDFVGRLRGRRYLRPVKSKGQWLNIKSLFSKALLQAQDMGHWCISPNNPFKARVVIGRRPRKTSVKLGQNHQRKARRRATEPWVLATSLEQTSPNKIERFYATRMQIEETFRDTKNHRFGWSFRHSMSRSPERIQVLLLLATLGMLAVTLVGQTAESIGLHRRYQANTIRTHRVLSLFVLGLNLIRRDDDGDFTLKQLEASASTIRKKIRCFV